MINEFNHNSAEKRNEEELRALQESGAHIARARFDSIPDASEFKGRLKAELMAKRELKRTSMWQKIREGLAQIVPTQKTFVFGMVVVLLVAVVTTMVINHPGGSQTGGTLAELLIDRAYAKDNFEITPTSGDELAVDSTTEFIIKSKTALTKDALLPHIHLLPATDFDLTQVSEHEFRVTPRGTLKEKQIYNIQIDAAYKDENNTTVERDFSFAFQVKNQFKLLSSIPGKSQSGVPLNSGIELTFSSENFSDYEKNFSIEPKTDGKFEVHGRTLVFVPKSLKPSTLYTVTVKKSLSVKGMDPLSNDVVIQFETQPKDAGSYGAYWYINKTKVEFAPTDSIVFSLGNFDGQDEFTIKASAFKSFDLYKKNLLKSVEIPNWAYETNKYFTVPAEDITLARTFTVKPQVASQEQNYLKLLVLPETLPKGDYWVEISTRNQSQHLFLEVTDLTTYLTVTTNKSLVWVNDLSTKAAVQGATVSLVNGESLGTTNHNGVAEFSTDLIHISTTTPPRYDFRHENRRVSDSTIQITRGTESTLLVSYANPYTLLSSSPARDQYILNVSTDRTLYLPNDTIKFWGFVQKRDRSAAPKTLTVGIPNTNNFFYGRSLGDMGFLQSVDVAVDDHGYFRGEIKLSNITPSGYSFVVRDGETEIFNRYLEINQYVKPGYTVSAVSDKHAYFTGENIRLNGDVKFFEGTPVPSYDLNYSDSIGAHNGMVTTDKNGHLDWNFTATVNPPNCEFLSDFNCYTGSDVYQNVMLSNVLPEETPINQNIPYSVYNAKIIGRADSLSKEKTAMTVSSTWNVLDLAPLNNDDYSDDEKMFAAPLSHHHIEGIVFESHYEQRETGQYYDFITKTTQKTYSYDQVTTSTMRISGETDDKGHFNVDVPVIDGRSYQVRLVSRDNEGHEAFVATYFYGGNNYSAGNQMTWYSLRNDDEKTRPEKIASGYKVGDSVHLSMYKNDTLLEDKNARILFTELQNGLQKYIVAQNPQYSFDFSDRDIPNVYVGAVYFDGKVYHDMAEGTFRTNIMFDTSERKLNIKIKTDKTLYKPADTVSITLQTLDKNNKGHAARVNISVIDKAYLALVGEKGAFVGGDVLSSLYMPLSDGTLVTQKSHQGADLGNFAGAEGGGCFLAGTPILLPDGTTKNIEDIVVGDSIRTLATETDNTAVTGRVTKIQNHIVSEYLIINGTLQVTPEHRVLVNGAWTTAGKIRIGDGVRGEYGQNVKVTSIEIKHELVKVYNFAVAQYHTYIAGGIYVHNDKGGAATRSNFPDVAYYNWVDTDTNGNATLTFKLPDSVTGWGVAAEAAATDFYAGVQTSVIDVSLPAFGLFGIPQDLLIGDKPQVTGAGYGSALSPKDTVTLKFMGDLFQSAVSKTVSAFTQVHVPADKAVSQSGKVRMELGSKGGKDAIEKSFTAVNSRVVESAQTVIALQNGQLDLGAAKNSASPVELNFVDAGTGSLYYRISDLAWNSGARLDQKVGTIVAHTWFKEFFTEEELGEPESLIAYVATNGFKLLPYGGAGDFDLSAKVAAVLKDTNSFDKETMRTIFVGKLYDTNANSSELASALWGAAALGEPVLPSIHSLAKNDKIAPQDKIRLALAATELGDSEYARTLYDELLKYAVQTDATAKIVFDKESQNAIIENSALMSVLGARLHESTVDKFDTFVQDEHKEILVNLESLLFVKEKLAQLPHGAGSLDIAIGSQKDTVKVENGLGHTLTLAPVNFNSVQISNLKGPIALVVKYDKPADVSKSSSMVKLTREYFVHGQKVESVKNGEVVEIRLTPVFAKDAPEGQYLVEDSLPSGLKVTSGVENINPWFFSSCVGVLPFEVDGQRIKFMFDKSYFVQQNISSPNKPFEYGCPTKPYLSYTARVSTLGEFRKEGALIESIESNDVKNFSSDTGMIQIGE